MSPQEAKIFHVEDDPDWREILADAVSSEGHRVVLAADNESEALRLVPQLHERGINVAILDDSLDELGKGGEGKRIARAIREHHTDMPIISFSQGETDYGNRHFRKGVSGVEKLTQYISEL